MGSYSFPHICRLPMIHQEYRGTDVEDIGEVLNITSLEDSNNSATMMMMIHQCIIQPIINLC